MRNFEASDWRRIGRSITVGASLFLMAISALVCAAGPSVAQDQPAADQPSDLDLSAGLVGVWTTSNDHLNALERKNIERGVFAVEQFYGGGSAKITVYLDKICGPVAAVSRFSWSIVDGVLITKSHSDIQHDKILSLEPDRLVLSSQEHQVFEYRFRTVACH
jgi:hypothetical protein